MNDNASSSSTTYTNKVGFLFIFNLIIGTGALALPKSFQVAGYGISIILTHLSCLTSYVCATFIIESMAIANAALVRLKRRRGEEEDDDDSNDTNVYRIKRQIEVSEMAKLFLNRPSLIISYLLLIVYLFGDLAIYTVTVSKSVMNVVCDPVNATVGELNLCWYSGTIKLDRNTMYRISVFVFGSLITPMVLVGITKTKYLQFSTSLCRWTAFFMMIMLATSSLLKNGIEAHPPFVNFHNFGSLFGTTVYAFMCHHSLPALITPIREKKKVMGNLGIVYFLILLFYIALSLTGSYAFQKVSDVYTLNFFHDEDKASFINKMISYFLALFPVFTLSTNYPIVANTLANNLCIFFDMFSNRECSAEERESLLSTDSSRNSSIFSLRMENFRFIQRKSSLFVVIVIPICISLITNDVLLLASLTGSYPGVGVQYIIPSLLVLYARRYHKKEFGVRLPCSSSSPFKSNIWPYAMLFWSTFTIVMVTLNMLKPA